jgi:hypothetical protein
LPGLPFLRQEYPGAGQTTVFLERNLLFLRYLAINFPGNLLFLLDIREAREKDKKSYKSTASGHDFDNLKRLCRASTETEMTVKRPSANEQKEQVIVTILKSKYL